MTALGSAEIRDFAVSVVVAKNVIAFEIAMKNAKLVKILEALDNLEGEVFDDVLGKLRVGVQGKFRCDSGE